MGTDNYLKVTHPGNKRGELFFFETHRVESLEQAYLQAIDVATSTHGALSIYRRPRSGRNRLLVVPVIGEKVGRGSASGE